MNWHVLASETASLGESGSSSAVRTCARTSTPAFARMLSAADRSIRSRRRLAPLRVILVVATTGDRFPDSGGDGEVAPLLEIEVAPLLDI